MNSVRLLRAAATRARPCAALPRRRVLLNELAGHRYASTETHERPVVTAAAATKSAPKPKDVRLTAESYPNIERDSRFSTLTPADIAHFATICPLVSCDHGASEGELEPFNTDWMRKYRGQSRLILKPKSIHDVSAILKYCNARHLAVVPQGGNTGLVGGSIPIFDEIIVSLNALASIRSFDAVSGILVVDAGVVLETADTFLAKHHHIFPLDLGAKGSCHVGGNVATNAGGLRLLRYGSLHGTVLGVEAVLPDGTILDDLSTLRKNNTGYDLKQLFIGSEGTLGIITAISIVCPPRPTASNVAFFALDSYAAVQTTFTKAKSQLGEILSAFEMMDGTSQRLVAEVTGRRRPLQGESPFYVLVETSGSNPEHDSAKLEAFLEDLMTTETVSDGVLAQDETQLKGLWAWREGIPECLGHWGGVYKYDVSIPLPELYQLVEDVRTRMEQSGLLTAGKTSNEQGVDDVVVDVVGYGHIGDSNLHLNVAVRKYDKRVEQALEPFVYEWIQKRRGSISAEHGLGVAKRDFVGYSRGEVELRVMAGLKRHFDPNGIMNPYKYIKA
ncbi:D-lactate ferricytochrome c oxidoreductase [Maublancomyces gigas]|uniref:D-lactate ferricytochrome c oxidoreductase n=1 Tax=Discina gigas TaxID=1032678 RepID=A0ABR3GJI7_9PEZI